jgi:hypothetical protein
MGLQRVWPVLVGDRGEHEDADERLALGGALGQAERAAVRSVLDQRAQALERRGALRGKVWSARPVLELGDQLLTRRRSVRPRRRQLPANLLSVNSDGLSAGGGNVTVLAGTGTSTDDKCGGRGSSVLVILEALPPPTNNRSYHTTQGG